MQNLFKSGKTLSSIFGNDLEKVGRFFYDQPRVARRIVEEIRKEQGQQSSCKNSTCLGAGFDAATDIETLTRAKNVTNAMFDRQEVKDQSMQSNVQWREVETNNDSIKERIFYDENEGEIVAKQIEFSGRPAAGRQSAEAPDD